MPGTAARAGPAAGGTAKRKTKSAAKHKAEAK